MTEIRCEDVKIYTTDIEPVQLEKDEVQVTQKENSVLIIEDNDDLRAFLKNRLANTYEIHEAETGEKGKSLAFEYLDGGCNEDVNLYKNTAELREVELAPYYLSNHAGSDLKTELFGHVYDAPFGIAPVGLPGLIWPNSPEILAKAAFEHNIPYIKYGYYFRY